MSDERPKSELVVECPSCGHSLRPNDESTNWQPPSNAEVSIGAIKCPSCGKTTDFAEWRLITAAPVTSEATPS